MPAGSAQCCVTSPPYFGLRDYGCDGQIGIEPTPADYIAKIVNVFREVWRVLRDDGVLWLNLGDSYANDAKWGGSSGGKHVQALHGNTGIGRGKKYTGLKPKDLLGIPWRVALALQSAGWYLRQDIIWHKPNPMPESVTDRCTKAHEYLFLLTKSERYYFDADAIKEAAVSTGAAASFKRTKSKRADPIVGQRVGTHRPDRDEGMSRDTRNRRSVWTVATKPYSGAHFAVFPPALIEPCVLAGSSERGGCPHCGAAWSRQTERTPMVIERSERTHGLGQTRSSGKMVSPASTTTLGWAPTCSCLAHSPVPQVVLDPFGGSGTTAEVACLAGRRAVLCELNPVYVDLAVSRVSAALYGCAA